MGRSGEACMGCGDPRFRAPSPSTLWASFSPRSSGGNSALRMGLSGSFRPCRVFENYLYLCYIES
ncbi:hypothetical protein HMPREF1556_01886 [Porphyromonas sp. oral taxon 278 str. W7784]|nr:hypothetical protein HMPREF1556_01886 [Porphyromonas sp. oral taxon 278 str. W7784]